MQTLKHGTPEAPYPDVYTDTFIFLLRSLCKIIWMNVHYFLNAPPIHTLFTYKLSLLASACLDTFGLSLFNFLNYIVWLRITEEGSVPEMRIWSILLIISDLKWCIHLSRSLFLYTYNVVTQLGLCYNFTLIVHNVW